MHESGLLVEPQSKNANKKLTKLKSKIEQKAKKAKQCQGGSSKQSSETIYF